MGPSDSLLAMRKKPRNRILSAPQERQLERFPLTVQNTSQHQETEAEKMQLLHFAAESGRGRAGGDGAPGRRGELCTASPRSAAGARHCLFMLPTHGFHFLLVGRGGKLKQVLQQAGF